MVATVLLLLLIAAFVGIVAWVFGRECKACFAKDSRIPRIPLGDEKNQGPLDRCNYNSRV